MFSKSFVALAASVAAVDAATKGFNYGSTDTNGNALSQSQFEALMNRANSLQGTSGFNSARLYTMIQADTTTDVIQAIPAAISTKTSLLLGMWASGGQESFTNEITALKAAIQQNPGLANMVVGLSVGSEDLYRDSVTGIKNNDGVGVGPSTIVNYIQQVRSALQGTALSGVSIGHVDTWDAWTNGSNSDVISNVDWLGVDSYPYFETTVANAIGAPAKKAFFDSYDATKGAAGGKPVWVTETGWPVSGPNSGSAVASTQNAETYWQDVGCEILGDINTWWYTLQDAMPTTPSPSFGIIGSDLSSDPLYDLTCKSNSSDSTSTSTSVTSKKSQPTSTAIGGAGGKGGNKGQSTTTTGGMVSSAMSSVSGKPTLSLNSTSIVRPTGTGSSYPSASANGTVPVSVSSAPSSGTTGPTPSVSPTQPSVNGAAQAGSAAGAAILAIFGLVAAI